MPHTIVHALKLYLTRPDGAPTKVEPEDWLVVVSQTCDVVAKDLDQEPFVEVLHCRPIPIWDSDPEGRKMIYKAFNEYVTTLDGCEGIQVNNELSGVVSGGEFSWQQAQFTDEWNFANLSHREA